MKYSKDELYGLVKKLSEIDAQEITVRSEDLTIKIKHGRKAFAAPAAQSAHTHNIIDSENATTETSEEIPGKIISAPIHGTFYASPGPDEAAFVKEGDRVKKGEPICILEAMKMMNTLNMPEDGVILSVEIENEDIVDSGQVLFRYETV